MSASKGWATTIKGGAVAALGYVPMTVVVAGVRKKVNRFACHACDEIIDIAEQYGRDEKPPAICKRATARGWVVDVKHKSVTRCPACATKRVPNDPNSELKKVIQIMVAKPTAVPVDTVPLREATPDQRQKIRTMLDKSFDDGTGRYLDDMSDERVAMACGVPRVIVERLREAAYGPLVEVDPELLKLKSQLAQLDEIGVRLIKDVGNWTSELGKVRARLAAAMGEKLP